MSIPAYKFLAYGVSIASNVDLGRYLLSDDSDCSELEFTTAELKHCIGPYPYTAPLFDSHGRKLSLCSDQPLGPGEPGQCWKFVVEDSVAFFWKTGSKEIRYVVGSRGTDELLAFWMVHIVTPLYLALEKRCAFLHAGAVEVNGKALLFLAPSMGGKSTLTEYFLREGHVLISDDKVAVKHRQEKYLAIPSHGGYRPYRRPADLGLKADNFTGRPAPIQSCYLLQRTEADADVAIDEIEGLKQYQQLLPNYLFGFCCDEHEKRQFLGSMLNQVSLCTIRVPHDLTRLGEVYQTICEYSDSL